MEFLIQSLGVSIVLCLIELSLSAAQSCNSSNLNPCSQGSSNWVGMWYVWLILLAIFTFLSCGITVSCVKFCCKKKVPPAQAFPRPYEVTVIPIEDDSSVPSSAYNSLHYPPAVHSTVPVGEMENVFISPPPYSMYASELPPSYDEAIHMGKPFTLPEAALAGQKSYRMPEQPHLELTNQQQPPTQEQVGTSSEENEAL